MDDLQNYMQDFEMRLNADLDLHYVAIGTPDSIEAVSDTSPTSDEGGSEPLKALEQKQHHALPP